MKSAQQDSLEYSRALLRSVKKQFKDLKEAIETQVDQAYQMNATLNNTIDDAISKDFEVKEKAEKKVNTIV